jgi:hypothetical protein
MMWRSVDQIPVTGECMYVCVCVCVGVECVVTVAVGWGRMGGSHSLSRGARPDA